ncbi:hypothetical protein Sjap_024620 [Stephania japonica]|uniref:BED-type domain-containing protein n=1 Tax=Stephania japonica TaxID=461633 RepID=A0AAP0EJ32_9MAGN
MLSGKEKRPKSASAKSSVMESEKTVSQESREMEMESPTASQKTVSDDDEIDYSIKPEFYDPNLDDKDDLWAHKNRRGHISDAILSCPACFTTLCIDCQSILNMSTPHEVDMCNTEVEPKIGTKRRRKSASGAWSDFVALSMDNALGDDDLTKVQCKHCYAVVIADSSREIDAMWRHVSKCTAKANLDAEQRLVSSSFEMENIELSPPKLNQEEHCENMLKAIFLHDLPFKYVEYDFVRKMLTDLNPEVEHVTHKTIEDDALKLYRRERKKLFDYLQSIPGRFCLAFDLWTFITTDDYISFTAHFIDKDSRLQKRILNFRYMQFPFTGIAISETVYSLLNE